jgi:hypothetical protein
VNRDKAIRYAFYQAIQALNVNGADIPVYDAKVESNEGLYVIMSTQFATRTGNLKLYMWRASIDIEIYHNQQNSATNDLVDDVGEAIENIISPFPDPIGSGIVQQNGWDITDVYLNTSTNVKLASYMDNAGTTVNKTLQFNCTIIKTS